MTDVLSVFGPVSEDVPLVQERLRSLANGHHPLLTEAMEHVFRAGGKRLRSTLVLLSGKLGDYHRDRLITLAAAIETVHTATLVHDDSIDRSLTRRGLQTVNAVWDDRVAILMGDYLFAQSAELASQLDNVRIMSLLSRTVMSMSSAELLQYSSTRTRLVDESDYFQRIAGKTASLFAMCCEGAAILSGQTEERIEALRAYGLNLGLAFQIADDVLDIVGEEVTMGKPTGNDLRQGTITLPVILWAHQIPTGSSLGDDLAAGTNVEGVVEAVRRSEAPTLALERAHEYAATAVGALDSFEESEPKEALIRLTERIINREF